MTLVLVDGNGIFARVFYGNGTAEGAREVVASITPDGAEVKWCFDSPPYWRTQIHGAYKATRHAHPPGYAEALGELKASVGGVEVPSFEADDVIATLAHRAGARNVRIITTDKDLLQLVCANVEVWRPSIGGWLADTANSALGIQTHQVVDFLALIGDSSDNVPGVPGIGKKKAARLLAMHEDLDRILEEEPIVAHYAVSALLSQKLVRLRFDVPVPA